MRFGCRTFWEQKEVDAQFQVKAAAQAQRAGRKMSSSASGERTQEVWSQARPLSRANLNDTIGSGKHVNTAMRALVVTPSIFRLFRSVRERRRPGRCPLKPPQASVQVPTRSPQMNAGCRRGSRLACKISQTEKSLVVVLTSHDSVHRQKLNGLDLQTGVHVQFPFVQQCATVLTCRCSSGACM